jgi:uncharacterized protein (TIGR02452 family)
MGRTEKSQGLAPPSVRKDMRAKQAKQIINKTIPALLASNARARKGSENSELISDPGPNNEAPVKSTITTQHIEETEYVKRKGQGRRKLKGTEKFAESESISKPEPTAANLTSPPKRRIRIITTDTLTAASILTFPAKYGAPSSKLSKIAPNTCILSMASPLRPGGGVLTGATSQEEFLCARTTLIPSLAESFYRLPELGGIWSPDVLVFRNSLPLGDAAGEVAALERFFVDVISAGMLRFPELEAGKLGKRDREAVEKKMRAVLRLLERKGSRRVVLGAWGCGAYGVPVADVAGAWRRVIDGSLPHSNKKSRAAAETWPGIQEIVFAISNRKMAADFADAFDPQLAVEDAPGDVADEDSEEEDKEAEELRTKIREMEGQVSQVWNADLKARMGIILEGLKAQLHEREGKEDDEDDEGEESVGGVQLTPEDSEDEEEEDDTAYIEDEAGDKLTHARN